MSDGLGLCYVYVCLYCVQFYSIPNMSASSDCCLLAFNTVNLYVDTNVSEEHTLFIFRVNSGSCKAHIVTVLCNLTPCSPVVHRHFGECIDSAQTCSSETLAFTYKIIRCHNPKCRNMNQIPLWKSQLLRVHFKTRKNKIQKTTILTSVLYTLRDVISREKNRYLFSWQPRNA
jgi:hypothetical protein